MTLPRSSLVSLASTPFYHCVARCVRRAFLCGRDAYSGRCYEHRKQWVVDRLAALTELFAIDICAYAVMSNHYHLVVHLDPERMRAWSDLEVIERWRRLFGLPLSVAQYQKGEPLGPAEQVIVQARIDGWRSRLVDLSWFMRCLNEHLARKANVEDECTGRFWEGRFKSQALLDEAAVLTCMSYVDLNPIRAGLARIPEESDFTSIQARIRRWAPPKPGAMATEADGPVPRTVPIMALGGGDTHQVGAARIAFSAEDYLALVDWAGRAIRQDKRRTIESALPPILTRMGIDPRYYMRYLRRQELGFASVIGSVRVLREAARQRGKCFFRGLEQASRLFPGVAAA